MPCGIEQKVNAASKNVCPYHDGDAVCDDDLKSHRDLFAGFLTVMVNRAVAWTVSRCGILLLTQICPAGTDDDDVYVSALYYDPIVDVGSWVIVLYAWNAFQDQDCETAVRCCAYV